MLSLGSKRGKIKTMLLLGSEEGTGTEASVIQPGGVAVRFLVCVFFAGGGGRSVWAAAEAPPRSPPP